MFICSVPEIPSMPIGRSHRHGHIFHPVRSSSCHSRASVCNSLFFRTLSAAPLSCAVKKLYISVNLLYIGDMLASLFQVIWLTPGRDGGLRRSSPLARVPSLFGSQCRLHPPSPSGLTSFMGKTWRENAGFFCHVFTPSFITH